jgi:uncharacterized membrane protein YeiB
VVLLPLGLVLQTLGDHVLVILQYYAVYFLIAGMAVRLPDRTLLSLTAAVALAGPLLYLAAWHVQPGWFEGAATTWGASVGVVLRQLLLSGSYPALVWSAPLLFGVWLGRRDLRAPIVQLRLVVWGLGVAIAAQAAARGLLIAFGTPQREPSWLMLVLDDPHSEMPLWLIGSTGAALAVLGLLLWAVARWPRATWPLAAMGQLAFTLYVGHLLVLRLAPGLLAGGSVTEAVGSVLRCTAAALVAATLWRAFVPRGPLEWALRPPWAWRSDRSSEVDGRVEAP